jgi:hypothetical protein
MQDLLLWGGVFVLSLTTLVIASRFFTEAAEVIGLSLMCCLLCRLLGVQLFNAYLIANSTLYWS